MTARANDDVLDAAGDVDVASGHVRAVGAVYPAVANELAGLDLVMKIAACRGRPPKLEPSFLPLAEFEARLIADANFVTGERLAAGHDLERFRVVRLCRISPSMHAELIAVDAIDHRRPAERWEGESDRALSKTIDRRHGSGRKTI